MRASKGDEGAVDPNRSSIRPSFPFNGSWEMNRRFSLFFLAASRFGTAAAFPRFTFWPGVEGVARLACSAPDSTLRGSRGGNDSTVGRIPFSLALPVRIEPDREAGEADEGRGEAVETSRRAR